MILAICLCIFSFIEWINALKKYSNLKNTLIHDSQHFLMMGYIYIKSSKSHWSYLADTWTGHSNKYWQETFIKHHTANITSKCQYPSKHDRSRGRYVCSPRISAQLAGWSALCSVCVVCSYLSCFEIERYAPININIIPCMVCFQWNLHSELYSGILVLYQSRIICVNSILLNR